MQDQNDFYKVLESLDKSNLYIKDTFHPERPTNNFTNQNFINTNQNEYINRIPIYSFFYNYWVKYFK